MTVEAFATYALLGVFVAVWLAVAVAKRLRRFTRRHKSLLSFLAGLAAGQGLRQRRRNPARPPLAGDDMWAACPLSKWGKGRRDLCACRWCNGRLDGQGRDGFCSQWCRDTAKANHFFADARKARRAADNHTCTECGKGGPGVTIEVDHITPVLGQHNTPGCWHHQAGLRSLCGGGGKSCHQKNTNRQRRNGEFNRRRAS